LLALFEFLSKNVQPDCFRKRTFQINTFQSGTNAVKLDCCSQARLLQSSSTAAVKLDCCSQAQLNLQLLSSAKTGAKLSCKRKFKIVRVHSVGFLETWETVFCCGSFLDSSTKQTFTGLFSSWRLEGSSRSKFFLFGAVA